MRMSDESNHANGAHRTRRNIARAAALVLGGLFALPTTSKRASANHWGGGGGGCFLRGTRIRTVKGYRRIETLAPGDLLPTRFGSLSPIKKVSSYTAKRSDPAAAWPDEDRPVRVARSALDDAVPSANLYLTPSHAIFVDGVLVPIGQLVNGVTIAFDDAVAKAELEYFHIELETHDVIEAEGTACETLREETAAACAPILAFPGGRAELKSRLRSAAAIVVDRRQALDVIRDNLEERALSL